MRFMMLMIPKGYETAAPGAMPDAKAVEARMKYNKSLKRLACCSRSMGFIRSALEASSVLRKGLGEPFISAYLKLRHADWNEYAGQLTEWERRTTLIVQCGE